ncbi:adenine phosphoribosyltransferase [Prochlorococcus marinus]|uniref:adenine phosphoribosyltransferase n=1 Tax=Prochlorococcus marinus TaxID=1219 RepID=UPI0005158C57|nr:adenine phosphoribosyltransferase [Prochlorococcus marinus]
MKDFQELISSYRNFPRKGIVFKDLLGILKDPDAFKELIYTMSEDEVIKNCDAIACIDARGFIFGSPIAFNIGKPMVVLRKPGKLPGELITADYELEYGKNSLSIQKSSIEKFSSFAIVDDLLATGGTANCAYSLLSKLGKEVTGLSVVAELRNLNARQILEMEVVSQIEL